jgi:hypothetical protein
VKIARKVDVALFQALLLESFGEFSIVHAVSLHYGALCQTLQEGTLSPNVTIAVNLLFC